MNEANHFTATLMGALQRRSPSFNLHVQSSGGQTY